MNRSVNRPVRRPVNRPINRPVNRVVSRPVPRVSRRGLRGRAAASAATSALASPFGRGDVAASLVLIFPLLLVYQLAIVVWPSVVATDPVSRALFSACHGRSGYLLVQALIAAGFLWWLHATGRARALALAVVAPVALEASLIALVMWLGLPALVHHALGLGVGSSVASAIGAGVYEELTFRLLLVGGVLKVAEAAGLSRRVAAVLAVTAAALIFALAHHAGAAGESWSRAAFAFRALAGLALGATFWFRSLAHATYAHVIYDLLVIW